MTSQKKDCRNTSGLLLLSDEVKHLDPYEETDFNQILQLTKHEDASIRSDALDALRVTGSSMVLKRCRECLEDPEALVRMSALEGIAEHGDLSDVAHVVPLLGDRSDSARSFAVNALGCIGQAEHIPLVEQFMNCAETERERAYACFALRDLGKPIPLATFLDFLHSDSLGLVSFMIRNIVELLDEDSDGEIEAVIRKISVKWQITRGIDNILEEFERSKRGENDTIF